MRKEKEEQWRRKQKLLYISKIPFCCFWLWSSAMFFTLLHWPRNWPSCCQDLLLKLQSYKLKSAACETLFILNKLWFLSHFPSYLEQSFKLSFHEGILMPHLLQTFLAPTRNQISPQKHETVHSYIYIYIYFKDWTSQFVGYKAKAKAKQSETWVGNKLTLLCFAPRRSCGSQCRLSELFEPQCCYFKTFF